MSRRVTNDDGSGRERRERSLGIPLTAPSPSIPSALDPTIILSPPVHVGDSSPSTLASGSSTPHVSTQHLSTEPLYPPDTQKLLTLLSRIISVISPVEGLTSPTMPPIGFESFFKRKLIMLDPLENLLEMRLGHFTKMSLRSSIDGPF